MKYSCPVPGFESDFIEVSDRWTRKEVRGFYELKGLAYAELLSQKILSVQLSNEKGPILTLPTQFALPEIVDDVDYHVWKWFSTAINVALDELYRLGEATASLWSKERDQGQTPQDNPKQK